MGAPERKHGYPIADGRPVTPPDHARVMASLSDAELEDEILRGRGDIDYRRALVAEADRRAVKPPQPS